MSSELTGAMAPESITAFLEDPTATIVEGITSEHIFIGSEEEEEESGRTGPYTVSQRYEINNRGRGIRTELTLFAEGFLHIRERRRGKVSKTQLINLRYLDPIPLRTRFVALRMLYSGLGLTGFGSLFGILAHFSVLPGLTTPAAISLVTAAAIAFMLFVYQTRERSAFYTSNGRAEVLSLLASVGRMRACRGLVPKLAGAIEETREWNPTEKSRHLREEMREHYRLREDGVLSVDECAASTQRILAQYD